MDTSLPPCTLDDLIRMDRTAVLGYDVFVEVIGNKDLYHIVLGGNARSKELDLGNTQRFLGVGLIEEIIKRYTAKHPKASVEEQGMAVVYYWQHSDYIDT